MRVSCTVSAKQKNILIAFSTSLLLSLQDALFHRNTTIVLYRRCDTLRANESAMSIVLVKWREKRRANTLFLESWDVKAKTTFFWIWFEPELKCLHWRSSKHQTVMSDVRVRGYVGNCERWHIWPFTGFLPTYGPSFIHFYGSGSVERNGCRGKCLTAMPLYRGRLLLSLKTEIDDPEKSSEIGVKNIPAFPIIEVIGFVVMFLSRDCYSIP